MGHFGDRLGRKSMLVYSLLLMGMSTLGIGLLPNYARIGIWAPILLVTLRFVQGFALGGEWSGAALMSVEHAPDGQRGLYGSFVALGLPAGVILSNLVFLMTSLAVTREQFTMWAWRIPFVASVALVVVGMYVRLGIAESPVFAEIQRLHAARRMPVLDVVRGHMGTVLLAAGSYLSSSALGFVAVVYFVSYATRELGLPLTTTLGILSIGAVAFAGSVVAFAIWSDRRGRRRVMTSGLAALGLWSLVFFPLIDTKSIPLVTLALSGMMVLQGPFIGSQPAAWAELFPATVRYSGVSLSLTIGTILGGALAPIIATTLSGLTGDSRLVTAYLATLSLISWLCGLRLKETYRQTISHRD
jgi:MFS family permease